MGDEAADTEHEHTKPALRSAGLISITEPSEVTEQSLVYILKRLRPSNFHEIISVGSTPANALGFIENSEDKWVISYKGEPTYVFGTNPSYPHVKHIFGLGTDRTLRIIPFLTKFVRTAWGPMHFQTLGTLRMEVRVPVSCVAAIGWLMKLGMKPECSLAHFSITGEKYIQLAYTKDDFDGFLKSESKSFVTG